MALNLRRSAQDPGGTVPAPIQCMSFVSFMIVGLAVGLMSRALGTRAASMGLLTTLLLSELGAFLGGALSFINAHGDYLSLRPSGLLASLGGALLVLFLAGIATGRVTAQTFDAGEDDPNGKARF